MKTFGRAVRILMAVAMVGAMGAAFSASANAADSTTWICKPGQSDDLCAGTILGKVNPPAGQEMTPLAYTRPADAPIDCFYLYPTQSEQTTPNSNLDKDPPIKRVVVQQARMFSSVCDVYAPMYNQVTFDGDQSHDSADVEVAYASAKAAFQSYLDNYNNGRGFIMIGHSQGSAMTGRLIDEMVDKDPELRKKFVGAIAPGANIYVPIGEDIGGMYDNVPACSTVGQFGCLTAFSTYKGEPGPAAGFSRLDVGYWIYPEPRPDPSRFEAVCTDPTVLDGTNGNLLPLVNYDYVTGVPPAESVDPWSSQPDYYKASCSRNAGAHWLNLSRVDPADPRLDLGAFIVGSSNNYHVPEVNLAEGNLLTIAQKQSDSYAAALAAEAARADALAKLGAAKAKLAKAKKGLAKTTRSCTKAKKAVKKAKKASKKATKKAARKATRTCKPIRNQKKNIKKLQADVKKYTELSQA